MLLIAIGYGVNYVAVRELNSSPHASTSLDMLLRFSVATACVLPLLWGQPRAVLVAGVEVSLCSHAKLIAWS
jgi:hypothetical protein